MKNKLVKVFDNRALAYDKYRPGYPTALIEDIMKLAALSSKSSALEIGCGTGQISMPFLKKGIKWTAIEKGAALAQIANEKFLAFKNAKAFVGKFEDWKSNEKFDLIISAQAFHWIDKALGYAKIKNLLSSEGSLALVWHMDLSHETSFWKTTGKVYNKYFPKKENFRSSKDMVAEYQQDLNADPFFSEVIRKEYPWVKIYDKEEYLGLLSTFSNHMVLPEKKRDRFFKEIEAIIEAHDNKVEKYFTSVVLLAL